MRALGYVNDCQDARISCMKGNRNCSYSYEQEQSLQAFWLLLGLSRGYINIDINPLNPFDLLG